MDYQKKEFAQTVGVSTGRLSNVLTHRNRPDSEFLIMLLQTYTNINSDYLMRGIGKIVNNNDSHLNKQNNGHLEVREPRLNYDKVCPMCTEKDKVIKNLELSYSETLKMLHETTKDKIYYKEKLATYEQKEKKDKTRG